MKYYSIRFFLLFFFVLFLCKISYAKTFEANYKIEVGGIGIGKLKWVLNIENNKYDTKILMQSDGVLSFVYKFDGKYFASGSYGGFEFSSLNYKQLWSTNKKKRNVELIFNDHLLIKILQSPIEKEYARINLESVLNYNDPLTSFLNILAGKKASRTIDGRRIYMMVPERLNKKNNIEIKKITIDNYVNIWSDHKRNDLEYIEVGQEGGSVFFQMPEFINIKFKKNVFRLKKI